MSEAMNHRDELLELLEKNGMQSPLFDAACADAILAAGYRPPARTITTIDELDALPDGTIVMSRYGHASNIYRNNPHLTKESFHYLLNAEGDFVVVLHDPEATA